MNNYKYVLVGYKPITKDSKSFYLGYFVSTEANENGRRVTTAFLSDKPIIDKEYNLYFGKDYKARVSKA